MSLKVFPPALSPQTLKELKDFEDAMLRQGLALTNLSAYCRRLLDLTDELTGHERAACTIAAARLEGWANGIHLLTADNLSYLFGRADRERCALPGPEEITVSEHDRERPALPAPKTVTVLEDDGHCD